jgi:ribonuclease BN (tRNA processing enzyme)
MEIEVGQKTDVLGHSVTTTEVLHFSGAPSTALRLLDGQRLFAYSGDTEWIDVLTSVADQADLFMVECYNYSRRVARSHYMGNSETAVGATAC